MVKGTNIFLRVILIILLVIVICKVEKVAILLEETPFRTTEYHKWEVHNPTNVNICKGNKIEGE